MIHLSDKAKELCVQWSKKGFNGIQVHAYVEPLLSEEDAKADGLTLQQLADWHRDYVAFIVEADFFPLYDHGSDAPYRTVEVDESGFWYDLKEFIAAEMGSGVTVRHYPGCNEFEVYRRSNALAPLEAIPSQSKKEG